MATDQPQASLNAREAFQSLKDNFVIVSAFAALFGVVCGTVFLYGYLAIFDWRLFWVIQYQDILTFALIAIGIIGGVGGILQGLIFAVLHSGVLISKLNWKSASWIAGVFALFVALNVFAESRIPHYFHIMYVTSCYIAVLSFTYLVASHVNAGTLPNARQTASIALSVIVACYTFGQTLGYIVLESREPLSDVTVKNQSFYKAPLILMTSHHYMFLRDKTTVVVPTDEVIQVTTATN